MMYDKCKAKIECKQQLTYWHHYAFINIFLTQHEIPSLATTDPAVASADNASLHIHSINNIPHSIHRRRTSSPASLSPQNYNNNRINSSQHHPHNHSILPNGNICQKFDWNICADMIATNCIMISAEIFNDYHMSDGRDSWPLPGGKQVSTGSQSRNFMERIFLFSVAPHHDVTQIDNFPNSRGDNSKFIF